jgi:O-antigen ligase
LAASLGVLAVIAVVLLPIVISRINPANAASRTSDQIHEQTAKLALNLLRAHPLTGVGLGAYGGYAHEPHLVSSAHSTFLTTAAELGVPGVLALLAAMGTTAFFAIRFVRRRHDSPDHLLIGGTAAAFVAIALANLVYEVWTDDFQWVFFGIVVGLTSQPAVGLKPAVVRRLRAARRRAGLPDVAAMRIDAERR